MGDVSGFGSGLVTTSYKMLGKDVDLTPTGITPSMLLNKLYENGATLVVLCDVHHPEISIKTTVNSLLADKSLKIAKLGIELDKKYQPAYESFVKGDQKPLKDIILSPDDGYAPPEKYPQLRTEYYDSKWKTFETTRDNGIKVAFVDKLDAKTYDAVIDIDNKITILERDINIAKFFRDKEGKPTDIQKMSKVEFLASKEKIIARLSNWYGGEALNEVKRMNAADFTGLSKRFFQEIGLDYNAPHSNEEISSAFQKRGQALQKEQAIAEEQRESLRDPQIFKNIVTMTQKTTGKEERSLVKFGGIKHFGENSESSRPNLEKLLRDKFGSKFIRIDIMPVSGEDAKKLGVAIGGRDKADYTIFVPGRIIEVTLKNTGKSVPAKDGPHKDKLKPLNLSQADILIPANEMKIAVTHDSGYQPNDAHQFSSGLSTALPKATPTKTV